MTHFEGDSFLMEKMAWNYHPTQVASHHQDDIPILGSGIPT